METPRIILAQLYSNFQPPNAEPFAVEVLAAYLERYIEDIRVDIEVINPIINDNAIIDFVNKIKRKNYQLIGLSVPQGTYYTAISLLDQIKEHKPNQFIVLGHAIPTYAPDLFLMDFPGVVIVHGWGEEALTNLINYVHTGSPQLKDIFNISYVETETNNIVSSPVKYIATPIPARRIDVQKYFARIETSRDCHYGVCTFCTRPPGLLRAWKRMPLDDILQSVQELKDSGITYFTFADEDFIGNDLDGALKIAEGLEMIGGVTFSISLRADNVLNPNMPIDSKENLLRKYVIGQLKKAGLSFMFIGLESLSETQLKRYGKGVKPKDSIKAINIIKEYEIPLEVGFILFDPFTTLSELNEITSMLRESGTWENAGRLFLEMRVQKSTAFEVWLRQKNLLGKFDPNTLSYEWSYQDETVAEIAARCRDWSEKFSNCHRLLLNLVRTDVTNHIAKYFIRLYKKLDLLMLEQILHWYNFKNESQVSENPLTRFEIDRYALSGALIMALTSSDKENREEVVRLIEELDYFRANIKRIIGEFEDPLDDTVVGFIENS